MIRFQVLAKSKSFCGGTVLSLGFGADRDSRVTFLAVEEDAAPLVVGEWYGMTPAAAEKRPDALCIAAEKAGVGDPAPADPSAQANESPAEAAA